MCKFRIGYGYDVHQLADGLNLVIGGVKINHTKGCVAHSDGDVVVHALCDALLGAAALGDIGLHFPDTSDQYKEINSLLLLQQTVELLQKKGYSIGNIDITLAMQRPKVRPYIDQMREVLSTKMSVEVDSISIKATTTEKLGFEGREEGVSAHAVALIFKNA